MKVEIDLNDIFHDDDYGSETLQESIQRQVVSSIVERVTKGISIKVNDAVDNEINRLITKELEPRIPVLIKDLIDAEYTPVDRYGKLSKPTTVRNEIIKTLQEQCVYKPNEYEKNVFTKTVIGVLSDEGKRLQKEFNSIVNEQFAKDALEAATKLLKEKLLIK